MKPQLYLAVILFLILCTPAIAQDYDYIRTTIQNFSNDISSTLPFLSNMGLNWSDAYIDTFPHLGLGATAAVAMLPYAAVKALADGFNLDVSFLPEFLRTYGVPLPALCAEARLGGFLIPFDMGFKVGFIPEPVKELLPSDLSIDYLMIGGDARFALVVEKDAIPEISIGLGVTYLSGSVTVGGVFPAATYDLSPYAPYSLIFDGGTGSLDFYWRALTVEAKAQISKRIAFMTVYLGLGEAYSLYAESGGGVNSPQVRRSDTGLPLSQADIDNLMLLLPGLDYISATGIRVKSTANGWGLRAFGGFSFDIFFVKLDIAVMYSIFSQSLGASFNFRLQF